MKITAISAQTRNPDRVNISVDGSYKLSLTIAQVVDLRLRVGDDMTDETLRQLEDASTYGKLYQRALEYALTRPRSTKEIREYLYRKTRPQPVRNRKTREVSLREGVSQAVADQVLQDLQEKGYVSDETFTDFWVHNRFRTKGVSARRLRSELRAKGIPSGIIEAALAVSDRNDADELRKIIAKKRSRYADDTKFMQYLARQGFSYDASKEALQNLNEDE